MDTLLQKKGLCTSGIYEKKGLKTKNLDLDNLCTSGYKFFEQKKGFSVLTLIY